MIESWDDACPIEGICAECGLGFEWGEMLSPVRNVPRWCVEGGPPRRLFVASFKTLAMILVCPGRFWREVRMTHPLRWGRIVMILVPMLLILYVVFAASEGQMVTRVLTQARASGSILTSEPWVVGLYAAIMPGSGYAVATRQIKQPSGDHPDYSYHNRSPTPRECAAYVLEPFQQFPKTFRATVRSGVFLWPWGRRRLETALQHVVLILLLCPLAFFALPQSLRRAKVRPTHIARIWLYSVGLLVVPMAFILVTPYGPLILWGWWGAGKEYVVFASGAGGLAVWWSLACRHYLKLPHAWGVGASMTLLSYASGLFVIISTDYLLFLFRR